MTDQGYRGPQVCKIVGITYRQLDYWARTDLVRPSVMDANGSGTQRLYSYRDLVELKVIKQMLDAGIALQSARKAVESLRSFGEDLASVRIVHRRVRASCSPRPTSSDRPAARRPGRAEHRAARARRDRPITEAVQLDARRRDGARRAAAR